MKDPQLQHTFPPHILFFDGVCNLCNKSVDFVIQRDRKEKILVAPLQGETAKQLLEQYDIYSTQMKTLIYWSNGRIYKKSNAVFEVIKTLGGLWKLALILKIFPRVFRDWVYDRVANGRYKWFGKKSSCRLPTPSEAARFLP